MSGPHSGRWAVVNGQSTVRNWTVNELQEARRYYASNTKSGAGRKLGPRDWNGNFGGYGAVPALLPGETFTFKGFTAPDNDAESPGNGVVYEGPAIVDSIAITWNWGAQELISYVCNFSGNGRLTNSVTTALLDSTDPDPPIVCGTKLEYNTGSADVEWDYLTQAVLTMTCENQAYLNSSTIDTGECWRERKKGNFDWTLALTEEDTDRDNKPDPGDDILCKLYVDGSTFWELKWGHIENFSNITADRESGTILSRQVNLAMNGFDGSSTGYVKKPDTTSIWPFA